MQKKIGIFYFSGTGNTEIIMNLLGSELINNGAKVDYIRIEDIVKDNYYYDVNQYDLIGFGYPIYAYNAPKIVYDFIKTMTRVQEKYTFIFRVAGSDSLGGGSTTMIKAKLKKRGYDVFHESLYILSSNFLTRYPDDLVKQLYYASAERAKRMTEEILTNKMKRQDNSTFIRMASFILSKLMGVGAIMFGKDLKVSKKCTQCNRCVKNCPVGNIKKDGLKVKFGGKCIWCMRCIYRCPERAISPSVLKFVVLKEPYNVQSIVEDQSLLGEYTMSNPRSKYSQLNEYISNIE